MSRLAPLTVSSRVIAAALSAAGLLLAALPVAARAEQRAQPPVTESKPAGRVTFVNGQVFRVSAGGDRSELVVNSPIYAGDRIISGANANAHIKMADDGLVFMRPSSTLDVLVYDYTPSAPDQTKIRFKLEQGETRTVSGKGAQAAKQNYRFNTPVAAIGIRGTDYTVSSLDVGTRVSVASGAVSVSPLGTGCAENSLGPCNTNFSRDLAAGVAHAYLEVRGMDQAPVLVPKAAAAPKSSSSDIEPPVDSDPAQAATKQLVLEKAAESAPKFVARWGRWSWIAGQLDGGPTVAQSFDPSVHTIVATSDGFVLVVPKNSQTLAPGAGQVNLKLVASEAYVKDISGRFDAAKVLDGKLALNFASQSFSTTMDVKAGAFGQQQVAANGSIDRYGSLKAQATGSQARVDGVVFQGGAQAAFLFEKRLTDSAQLLGATQWLR